MKNRVSDIHKSSLYFGFISAIMFFISFIGFNLNDLFYIIILTVLFGLVTIFLIKFYSIRKNLLIPQWKILAEFFGLIALFIFSCINTYYFVISFYSLGKISSVSTGGFGFLIFCLFVVLLLFHATNSKESYNNKED